MNDVEVTKDLYALERVRMEQAQLWTCNNYETRVCDYKHPTSKGRT